MPPMRARPPSKYGNVRTKGFASKKEARRYQDLRLLELAGEIKDLKVQPWFVLAAPVMPTALHEFNGAMVDGTSAFGQYRADFSYFEKCRGFWVFVVEDVKGHKTELYKWKARHMKAQYGITIREV